MWAVYEGKLGWHIAPQEDLRHHQMAPWCWCRPYWDVRARHAQWVHNSADGRELRERREEGIENMRVVLQGLLGHLATVADRAAEVGDENTIALVHRAQMLFANHPALTVRLGVADLPEGEEPVDDIDAQTAAARAAAPTIGTTLDSGARVQAVQQAAVDDVTTNDADARPDGLTDEEWDEMKADRAKQHEDDAALDAQVDHDLAGPNDTVDNRPINRVAPPPPPPLGRQPVRPTV